MTDETRVGAIFVPTYAILKKEILEFVVQGLIGKEK